MAVKHDGAQRGVLLALVVMALPFASGCLDSLAFDDDETTSPPWIDDECGMFGGGSTGSGPGVTAPPAAPEAGALIGEADIIEVEGDLIYALSHFTGLTVIDASAPDNLTVLDHHDPVDDSFEMYVRDGMVYVMTAPSYGDAAIEAFDAADPSAVIKTSKLSVPGEISDSRIVGDVLYIVSFDHTSGNGGQGQATTFVTSVSIANPSQLEQVDQRGFVQSDPDNFGWKRSVYATNQRMYVAGVEWDGVSNDGHSTIQVVDISDSTGVMALGAVVEPAGQIYSRWQMDEHEDVLRVITQPGIFSDEDVPKVETFSVASSTEIASLGFIEMDLAGPEALRAVRFYGPTAYVITAALSEPWDPNPTPPPPTNFFGDPLFVIDLTDPAQPLQRGELEIPGWVYHMEMRGSQILALGFDGNDPEGMINVSLFDVADKDAPALVDRVSFGGTYSGVIEDQNRIHKSFAILDELGLIVVPYGDYEEHELSDPCFGSFTDYTHFGALQLIDLDAGSLSLRGTARMGSQARRALVHRGLLLGMSDSELRAFDIDDRDHPTEAGQVSLF